MSSFCRLIGAMSVEMEKRSSGRPTIEPPSEHWTMRSGDGRSIAVDATT
jgi:hypothetical protein